MRSLLYSDEEAAHLFRSSAQCRDMSPHCCLRAAVPIWKGPESSRNPLVFLIKSSASSNCPASPRKRATTMHEREGSRPRSSEHCVAIATPRSAVEESGFCTSTTFLFPPGARIFSSAHSDRLSASAAGAVLVLRSASRHSFAVVVPQRYAFEPESSTTLPRNVPPAFSSSHIPPCPPCSTTLHSIVGCARPCTATPSLRLEQTMLCVNLPAASSSRRMPAALPSETQFAISSGEDCRPTYTPASSELRIMLKRYVPLALSITTSPRPAPFVSTLPSQIGSDVSRTAMLAPSLWHIVLPLTVTVVEPRMMMPPSGPWEMMLATISDEACSSSTMLPCALCDSVFCRNFPCALCRMSKPACFPSRMMFWLSVGLLLSVTTTPARTLRSITLFCSVLIARSCTHTPYPDPSEM
mmetsp:Transcript_51958/g.126747  ORF Transcript_51958/g.126747 Transcript_51958/m.126747 type:complete len:411 (-) Transcript_51958:1219-2451(-)